MLDGESRITVLEERLDKAADVVAELTQRVKHLETATTSTNGRTNGQNRRPLNTSRGVPIACIKRSCDETFATPAEALAHQKEAHQ